MAEILTGDTVRTFIVDRLVEFGVDRPAITRDAKIDDLEIDSLDLVDLTQSLKTALCITVSPRELDGELTVGVLLERVLQSAGLL